MAKRKPNLVNLIKKWKLSIRCYPDYVDGDSWLVTSDYEFPSFGKPVESNLQVAIFKAVQRGKRRKRDDDE